jgi:hypothetical protein
MLKASTLAGQTNLPETTGQQTTQEGSFQEVRRRKLHATDETVGILKEVAVQTETSPALNIPLRKSSPKIFHPPQDSGHGHRGFRYWGHFKCLGNSWQNK